MATISKGRTIATLINVFTVGPADQGRLVEVLTRATESLMSKQPGFISANIHKSLDGVRVVNYSQWRSREDFEAMLRNPEVLFHVNDIIKIARPDPHLYEIAHVHEA
jgi:quinol monooxygenase YgiN